MSVCDRFNAGSTAYVIPLGIYQDWTVLYVIITAEFIQPDDYQDPS